MTRRVIPCLVCGRNDHSSAGCESEIAGMSGTSHEADQRANEKTLLGAPEHLQGYLDNPPNMHLRRPKDGGGVDYRADRFRGYESWQFRVAPLGRWDDPAL